MADTIFFITDHSVQVDVLHTAEDILLNVRILLAKLPDQILDLRALGTLLRTAAGSTAFRETAGTLNKAVSYTHLDVYKRQDVSSSPSDSSL